MGKRKPIDWTKYPKRTCQTMHHCEVCNDRISLGQEYRDGGYGRRAHVECVSRPVAACATGQTQGDDR